MQQPIIHIIFLYAHKDEACEVAKKYYHLGEVVPCPLKTLRLVRVNKVLFAEGGIGCINAAAATTYLISTFHPYELINIGIAGALPHPHLELVDAFRIKTCRYNFFDLRTFGYRYGTTNHQYDSLKLSYLISGLYTLADASIITCNTFIVSVKQIMNYIPQATPVLIDMEAMAITEICHNLAFDHLTIIKIIADKITTHDPESVNFKYSQKLINTCSKKILFYTENIYKKCLGALK